MAFRNSVIRTYYFIAITTLKIIWICYFPITICAHPFSRLKFYKISPTLIIFKPSVKFYYIHINVTILYKKRSLILHRS